MKKEKPYKIKGDLFYSADEFVEWINIKEKGLLKELVMNNCQKEISNSIFGKEMSDTNLDQVVVTTISLIHYSRHNIRDGLSVVVAISYEFFLDNSFRQVGWDTFTIEDQMLLKELSAKHNEYWEKINSKQ